MDWEPAGMDEFSISREGGASALASPNVLYIGDSLFADLVDAKREFGWTTGASLMGVRKHVLLRNCSCLLIIIV